jgi:plasmid stabilization system protein ParE
VKYEVRLQTVAERDLEEAYLQAARHAPVTAAKWLARFRRSLATLEDAPERCGFAPEHTKMKRELRQILLGKKPHVFRACS